MDKEGKYLTFALANEEYGLETLKVREIFGYMDITAVPQTPHYVKGVINLRGQVIPVIDLRAKFGMETTDVTEETCIIVVEITQDNRKFNTGIVVDHVSEVLDIAGGPNKKSGVKKGAPKAEAVAATRAEAEKAIPMDDDKSDSEDDIKEFNS